MAVSKKTFVKEVKLPPAKFMSEVARLRDLQRSTQLPDYWLSEVAVQLARLVAQIRYTKQEEYGDYANFLDDVPF